TASRLLTAGSKQANDLGECLRRHLQIDLPKDQARSDWAKPILNQEQLQYSAEDVAYLHNLKQALETEIDKNDLRQTLDLELALLPVVVDVECRGIQVNREGLRTIKDLAKSDAEQRKTEMRQLLADPDFNPSSPTQVSKHLQARGNKLTDTKEETLVG